MNVTMNLVKELTEIQNEDVKRQTALSIINVIVGPQIASASTLGRVSLRKQWKSPDVSIYTIPVYC